MQKFLTVKEQIRIALVAAIYVAVTLLIAPISYGMVQFRLSEILNHLLVYNKKMIFALGLGVFIANFWSPFFLYDIIVGTGATLMCSAISLYAFKFVKGKLARFAVNTFVFSFIGMIPIAIMIMALGDPNTFWVIYSPLVLSELIILSVGAVAFTLLDKTPAFKNFISGK